MAIQTTSATKIEELFIQSVTKADSGVQSTPLSRLSLRDRSMESSLLKLLIKPIDLQYAYQFALQARDQEVLSDWIGQWINDTHTLSQTSQKISDKLIHASTHPNIKTGHLLIAHVTGLHIDGEQRYALIICKLERSARYLNISWMGSQPQLSFADGFSTAQVDKIACISFHDEMEQPIIYIRDRSNPESAQFWTSEFLGVQPVQNERYWTEYVANKTKAFISHEMPNEASEGLIDRVSLLSQARQYLSQSATYEESSYASQLFADEQRAEAFQSYLHESAGDARESVPHQFTPDRQWVNRRGQYFRSVIRLDKNFHIYIHGSRDRIERGIDDQGRKFYKLYYDDELVDFD